MQCNQIIEIFMQLDSEEVLPISIKKHISTCQICCDEIKRCQNIFQSLNGTFPFRSKRSMNQNIMRKISETKITSNISVMNWFLAGMVILGSIPLIAFSKYILWMKLHFGSSLAIPLHTVMGLTISIYTCLFIGVFTTKVKSILFLHPKA